MSEFTTVLDVLTLFNLTLRPAGKLAGMNAFVSPVMPDDEVWIFDASGTRHRIVNLGKSPEDKP